MFFFNYSIFHTLLLDSSCSVSGQWRFKARVTVLKMSVYFFCNLLHCIQTDDMKRSKMVFIKNETSFNHYTIFFDKPVSFVNCVVINCDCLGHRLLKLESA